MKTYKRYRVYIDNLHGKNERRFLRNRLTKRTNLIKLTLCFGHVFSTKKGALNSLDLLNKFGYNAQLETIVKVKKY